MFLKYISSTFNRIMLFNMKFVDFCIIFLIIFLRFIHFVCIICTFKILSKLSDYPSFLLLDKYAAFHCKQVCLRHLLIQFYNIFITLMMYTKIIQLRNLSKKNQNVFAFLLFR